MSEMAAEDLQQALAQANEVARTYGPLGGSLGILQLKPVFESMKSSLETMHRTLASVNAEIQTKRQYSTALETHIATLEERRRQLEEHTSPEERQLQARLSEIEGRIAQADELRRTAETASNRSVEQVAAWLRSVRGA